MEKRSVALDGPSGAGKSTIAKMAAKKFKLVYVDTGAIYRCVGLFALKMNADSKNADAISTLLSKINISISYDDDGLQRMFLNGKDVTDEIRAPIVSIYASDVSAIPEVRHFLLEMQRSFARENDIIMDGRDIGTVVLPNAGLKIFLTASAEERARRRYMELSEKGTETTYEDVLRDINYRDINDSTRAEAPLKKADDAVLLDTTGNTLEQSIDAVCQIISERFAYEP